MQLNTQLIIYYRVFRIIIKLQSNGNAYAANAVREKIE